MPLPRAVARFNKRYTNRFIEPVVRRFSGFAMVHHRGRRSGASYATPVNVFDGDGGLVVALTYGPSADWAQNVLAGPATIDRGDGEVAIASATVVGRSEAWPALPLVVRGALRVLRVHDFLLLETGEATEDGAPR